jgi:DNA-directed RNA polymerase subunit H (RpoH/RPB5)
MFDILQFNITKHDLVPKHIICPNDEISQVLKKYSLQNISQLPVISKDDAIMRYYNYKSNSVIKILRHSKTSGTYTFYRYVK